MEENCPTNYTKFCDIIKQSRIRFVRMDYFLVFLFLISFTSSTNVEGTRLECVTALGLEGYLCNNRKCMLKIWYCDGEKDCQDGSDEICDLEYTAPANLLQEYSACQRTLEECDFRYPSAIIPRPSNGKMIPTDIDNFCRYLDQFLNCTNGMNDVCYQIEESTLVYTDIQNRICKDSHVKNYTRLAMTGIEIWEHMDYILTALQRDLNTSMYRGSLTKREIVCEALDFLVQYGKITGHFWYWKFDYNMNIPDDRLLFDVPMQTFFRLMRPLDIKYGDLRLSECNRGRTLGYRNVYVDYREILGIMAEKYGM